MQDKSMYTYDYPGHQGAHPAQPIKRREQTRPSGSKFDAMPTYSREQTLFKLILKLSVAQIVFISFIQ